MFKFNCIKKRCGCGCGNDCDQCSRNSEHSVPPCGEDPIPEAGVCKEVISSNCVIWTQDTIMCGDKIIQEKGKSINDLFDYVKNNLCDNKEVWDGLPLSCGEDTIGTEGMTVQQMVKALSDYICSKEPLVINTSFESIELTEPYSIDCGNGNPIQFDAGTFLHNALSQIVCSLSYLSNPMRGTTITDNLYNSHVDGYGYGMLDLVNETGKIVEVELSLKNTVTGVQPDGNGTLTLTIKDKNTSTTVGSIGTTLLMNDYIHCSLKLSVFNGLNASLVITSAESKAQVQTIVDNTSSVSVSSFLLDVEATVTGKSGTYVTQLCYSKSYKY